MDVRACLRNNAVNCLCLKFHVHPSSGPICVPQFLWEPARSQNAAPKVTWATTVNQYRTYGRKSMSKPPNARQKVWCPCIRSGTKCTNGRAQKVGYALRVANLEEWYVNPLCIKPPATRQPFGTEDCGAKTIKREVLEVDIIDIYFTQKTLLHAMCGCRSCKAVCTSINLKGGRTVDPATVRRCMWQKHACGGR